METITKDTIITLDNNENYFVESSTYYNDVLYHLLINVSKEDYKIVKEINENNETIVEFIEDESELLVLLSLFQKDLD